MRSNFANWAGFTELILDSASRLAVAKMEPPAKKPRKLLDDDSSSDSGDESGGVPITDQSEPGFKINEEYARRFEHNKKREELQKRMYSLLAIITAGY